MPTRRPRPKPVWATPEPVPASRETIERRRSRRAVLRAHHPDLGGDAAELARRLRLLDAPGTGDEDVVFVRRPRGLRRLTAWWRARRDRRRHARVQ